MVDDEKRENLANARRKLKKFRDQQLRQQQNGSPHSNVSTQSNGNDVHLINGTFTDSSSIQRSRSNPPNLMNFVDEQQAILNGLHENLSKSPVTELEERNRQYALLIENQKQQRARLEDQIQFGLGNTSGRSSQAHSDVEIVRQIEQKYRRDVEHLQEQLEIHVQTIGILVAEKSDLSAKLTQSVKQIERKQNEIEEIQGRLKASREKVEELERHTEHSTFNSQKREMAAKETDKEVERLKIENHRQIQQIEDLKENLLAYEKKFHQRQTTIDQLNDENSKLKQKLEQSNIRLQQLQSVNDVSLIDQFNQQINELNKIIQSKSNEIEALLSSLNENRSNHEQMQFQYQQFTSNLQRQIQELNEQIKQLIETNQVLEGEQEAMKQTYDLKLKQLEEEKASIKTTVNDDLFVERDALQQENQSFRTAIDQWSKRCETIQADKQNLTTEMEEKEKQISLLEEKLNKFYENSADHDKLLQSVHEDKSTLSRAIAQNKQLKEQLIELEDRFVKMSNDNMNLTNQIQAQQHLNKQLNERLTETQPNQQVHSVNESSSQLEQSTQESQSITSISSFSSNEEEKRQIENEVVQKIIDRFNRAMRDNADLQDRTQQMEHLILQLQSETDTIGDYISLYQQQRQQLHRRYQEKDDYIKQLTQERLNLQKKLSELESLLLRGINKSSSTLSEITESNVKEKTLPNASRPDGVTEENEWPEMIDGASTPLTNNETTTVSETSSTISSMNFDDETKTRILTLLKELGETNSSAQSDRTSNTKLAFIGKNLYVCSTCTGPVQWV